MASSKEPLLPLHPLQFLARLVRFLISHITQLSNYEIGNTQPETLTTVAMAVEFLIVAAEVAGYIKAIVDAITAVDGFVNGLKKKKDNSAELLRYITALKNEIVATIYDVELRGHLTSMYSVADSWYDTDEGRIKRYGLTKETLDNEDGELSGLQDQISRHLDDLRQCMNYFTTRPKLDRPESPQVLTGIMLCGVLLTAHLAVESRIFYVKSGETDSAELVEGRNRIVESLNRTTFLMGEWVQRYYASRRALINWSFIRDPSVSPGVSTLVGSKITLDRFAGDEFLGNLTGREMSDISWTHEPDRGLVSGAFEETEIYQKYSNLYRELSQAAKTPARRFASGEREFISAQN
ncbi:hypothetical protein B0T16DRAFT_139680 [Cercophora newfieldiana]|uniref:Uncharacterized protein n=1 Tax=Cercophora newfieldiana TaxID=92897 RepID=A0AA39Y3M2_9PEZI|nr:hypothetical protein B0T16DRAFT_139680 [Cercophora newfieldiana]